MIYTLTQKSNSYLSVSKSKMYFEFIPNSFEYEKTYPDFKGSYKKVITIRFRWLCYSFDLVLRKRNTKSNEQDRED